ncbi:MAG: apolipoprotein N-acyltransferase [Methyloglobulus sp.]|nr:apolipoprotein N-acyltransferase [Methyloglobulus sp.]
MNNNSASNSPNWYLPLLSGIFIGTSYIPFPPWASLFGFVPLWLFWMRQSGLKNIILGGVMTAFVFTMIGFNWVTYTLHEFAHLPWFLSVIGMLVYGLIGHLFVPVAGLLWYWGKTRFRWSERLSLWLMTLITVLCEAYSLTLFDWNFGYTWYGANIPVYHWAEVVGFSGLSAATLLCNLPLYVAWQKRKQHSGKLIFASVITGFILLNLGGLRLQARLPKPDAKFNTLLIQASIPNSEKMAAELGEGYAHEIVKRIMTLTDQALARHKDKIDFAMWPETAFPALLGDEFRYQEYPVLLSHFLAERQLPLITGAYSVDDKSRLVTNSLFLLDEKGEIVPPHYSKTILLAFGEYIPFAETFPIIRKWLPPIGQFARGPGPTMLFDWHGFKMGPQICYESLFPKFSRDLANLGAQFIVNATNDSWYGTWQEPYQHMYMTLARGVEFRRPVLRVTNSGISTVALASGEVLERSPMNEAWAGFYEVPYVKNPPVTFYQQWFWLVPCLLWGSLFLLLIVGVYKNPAQFGDDHE